jgi:dTMP kinase
MAGLFIVLEGGDGVGKTSAAHGLADRLRESGRAVAVIENPGATPAGQALRGLLVDPQVPLSSKEQVLLYTAARSSISVVIQDRLEDNEIVICTRWVLSTLVYQNPRFGIGSRRDMQQFVLQLHDSLGLPDPDICVVLDCDPEIALPRCGLRPHEPEDRFQQRKISWHRTCRDDFRNRARQEDYPIVSAEGTQEQTLEAVWEVCMNYPCFAEHVRG